MADECLKEHDVVLIVDVPDIIPGTALALAVSSSGLVRTRTTPLLTIEEADRALAKAVDYRPPRPLTNRLRLRSSSDDAGPGGGADLLLIATAASGSETRVAGSGFP